MIGYPCDTGKDGGLGMTTKKRTAGAMCLVLACAAGAGAADMDSALLVERKYAWPQEGEIALDGAWQLAAGDAAQPADALPDLDGLEWFDATVPTGVHWALHRAGKAPHPYVGLNAKELRWVEDKAWWFRKRFAVPKDFQGENVRLIFEGVDYYGRYWLNGKYLGHSEGAFGAVKINVWNLKPGAENELVVRVDCSGYKVGKKGGAPWASLVKSELWSGWQVGAADFNTVGIWQPVRLIANRWPCLERPFVRTLALAAGGKRARLGVTVEVCAGRRGEAACEVIVTVREKEGEERSTLNVQRLTINEAKTVVTPQEGMVLADLELEVEEPKLWWPVGLGDQPLYEAEIVLARGGERLDRLTVPFGIRTVERRAGGAPRTSYAAKGWVFHVNDRPFFVKGVNWMPVDALGKVEPEDYAWNLRMARDAGIQMIRVWGGGILETDAFYEQCDRLGILVWQDFPLTCGWKAEKLNRKVWEETVPWHVFRLRNHPSLAFWCGGNEFPPDDRRNADLVGTLARAVRILDGTRPFMAASPDEGDIHGYPQWDASQAWRSELLRGPFISEWGTHAMPAPQTYRETLGAKEADAVMGPVLLKMDKKLMAAEFPEIMHHWVEFQPDRLTQMLARGSAFDDLAAVPLGRFSDAVAAGAAEFCKYSCEAARTGFPRNGGLLLWVWKRPWPNAGIQLVDGMGRPLAVYYDVKRAYGPLWPCLKPPHLNYAPGERVEIPTAVLHEAARVPSVLPSALPGGTGVRVPPLVADGTTVALTARLVGPDLKTRQTWDDLPAVALTAGAEADAGPSLGFTVPDDFARSFFFVVLEARAGKNAPPVRNVYTFRCPPQLEDAGFREHYRAKAGQGLFLDKGPWLRPQLEKRRTELALRTVAETRDDARHARVTVEIRNAGPLPAVAAHARVEGPVCVVADDACFWLEPSEARVVTLRVRSVDGRPLPEKLEVAAEAWNAPGN
jgi:beta-mannosidase